MRKEEKEEGGKWAERWGQEGNVNKIKKKRNETNSRPFSTSHLKKKKIMYKNYVIGIVPQIGLKGDGI